MIIENIIPITPELLAAFLAQFNATDVHAARRVSLHDPNQREFVVFTDKVSQSERRVYVDCTTFEDWCTLLEKARELTEYRAVWGE